MHYAKFVDHPLPITMALFDINSRLNIVCGQNFGVDSIYGVPGAERTLYDRTKVLVSRLYSGMIWPIAEVIIQTYNFIYLPFIMYINSYEAYF